MPLGHAPVEAVLCKGQRSVESEQANGNLEQRAAPLLLRPTALPASRSWCIQTPLPKRNLAQFPHIPPKKIT